MFYELMAILLKTLAMFKEHWQSYANIGNYLHHTQLLKQH